MTIGNKILGVEWLDYNAKRRYPFVDEATLVDDSGYFTLPESIIVDLTLSVPASTASDMNKFYVGGVTIFGTGIVIEIYYDGSLVGKVPVNSGDHYKGKTYTISGEGSFVDVEGRVTVWDIDDIAAYAGSYTFSLASTRIIPTLIRPGNNNVASISLGSDPSNLTRLQGNVRLIAGDNITLTYDSVNNGIIVNAIDGRDLNATCACSEQYAQSDPIKTINGIAPDSLGNINIIGSSCINVVSAGSAINLKDSCSEPCCGSPELEETKSALDILIDDARSLRQAITSLENGLTKLEFIASIISGTGYTS